MKEILKIEKFFCKEGIYFIQNLKFQITWTFVESVCQKFQNLSNWRQGFMGAISKTCSTEAEISKFGENQLKTYGKNPPKK